MAQGKTIKRIMALRAQQGEDHKQIQKLIRRMSHRAVKIKNIEKNRQLNRVEGYYPYQGHFIQEHDI